MKAVQFDQNINDRRLAKRCAEEGLVDCFRFPARLHDADDDEVLQFACDNSRLLVTLDKSIADDHPEVLIQNRHSGLLIVSLDDDDPRTIGTNTAARILSEFKRDFADWHKVPWEDSVVDLRPSFVHLRHTEQNRLVNSGVVARQLPEFISVLSEILTMNAARRSSS